MTTANVNMTPDPTDVRVAIARMEEKLDSNLKEMQRITNDVGHQDGRVGQLETRVTTLETQRTTENTHVRLTALEKRIWGWVGAASVLSSAGVGAIFHYLN